MFDDRNWARPRRENLAPSVSRRSCRFTKNSILLYGANLRHSSGPLGHGAVTQLAPKRESAVSWVLFLDRKESHRLATEEARWLVNLARTQVSSSLSDGRPTTSPDRNGAIRAVEGTVARPRATQRLRRNIIQRSLQDRRVNFY
jgi:hypothetical protein